MESKPKNSLVRIACYEGNLSVDPSGKAKGRGVYLCPSQECMEKARKRLLALGLDNRATFAVADGLAALDALKQPPDTVFVLGMGGETIGGILHRGHTRLGGAALILGAQTDLPMVRRTVCEVGYRIRSEVIASAGGRDYVLMRCTPARARFLPLEGIPYEPQGGTHGTD